jgi:pseudaminic acid biosynthesis-associated methylase
MPRNNSSEKSFATPQEKFWAEQFGNAYIERNRGPDIVASNISLLSKPLSCTEKVDSVIEFGSNIGLNLLALRQLLPQASLSAIEINANAILQLKRHLKNIKTYPMSILDFSPDYQRDFVLIKGVLIHINPDKLNRVYDLLYETSKRYICLVEYYNPTPVAISYRGESDKLFKRDFAGELLDRFSDSLLQRMCHAVNKAGSSY